MGFVANFIRFSAVQQFWKSVKIWQSYSEFKGGNIFWDTGYQEGSHGNPLGMGSTTLVLWEWESPGMAWWEMGGNENTTRISQPEQASKPIYSTYTIGRKTGIGEKWPDLDICICNLISSCFWYQNTSISSEFTGYLFHDAQHNKQQQAQWHTNTGITAGGDGNNRSGRAWE